MKPVKKKIEGCELCERGWIPCDEHPHSSMCNKWVNGHYKKITFKQDEVPPKTLLEESEAGNE